MLYGGSRLGSPQDWLPLPSKLRKFVSLLENEEMEQPNLNWEFYLMVEKNDHSFCFQKATSEDRDIVVSVTRLR